MREQKTKQRYYTDIEVAAYLNQSVKTIRKWRRCGCGPTFHKFGRSVRYLITDLELFEQQNRRTSTSSNADLINAGTVGARLSASAKSAAATSGVDVAGRDK